MAIIWEKDYPNLGSERTTPQVQSIPTNERARSDGVRPVLRRVERMGRVVLV